jgi:nucleotide-binding universal stress UspA family protein
VVLHAYEYAYILAGGSPMGLPSATAALHETVRLISEQRASAVLRKYHAVFKSMHRLSILHKCLAQKGAPKDIIVDYARDHKMDLVVTGSRNLTGLRKWVGSVSSSILHNVSCNTLVVKAQEVSPPNAQSSRRIVVAIDGSPHSEKAFLSARETVMRQGDVVTLVMARQEKIDETLLKVIGQNAVEPETKSVDALIDGYMGSLAEQAQKITGNNCRVLVQQGDAREVILAAVEKLSEDEHHTTLLVMGSRGMGTIKRALVGSVVDYCAAHTLVPLLVVK